MEDVDGAVALLLMARGQVDSFKLHAVRNVQARRGGRLHRLVVEMGFVDEARATDALAQVLELPLVSFGRENADPRAIALLEADFCRQHLLLPFALREDGVHLVMADPTDESALAEARTLTGQPVHPMVGAPSEIGRQIELQYNRLTSPLPARPTSPQKAPLPQETPVNGALTIEQRLERIAQNHLKSARIISGLTRLLVEKGLFSAEELSRQQR